MNIPRLLAVFVVAIVLAACGTVEDNAWGIPRGDAYVIRM